MAASANFALKAGVWFRRGRLFMVSPDSRATACPPSGRNSTYRPVQISGTGSLAKRLPELTEQLSKQPNSKFTQQVPQINIIGDGFPLINSIKVAGISKAQI